MNKVCYTAIIGNYEELKEPSIVSDGWDYVCFTDQPLVSNVWKIIPVKAEDNKQRQARKIKILFHHYIDAQYSMWVDGSFQINKDLNDWWRERFVSPFSCAKHPVRSCVFRELNYCIVVGSGDVYELQNQYKRYQDMGLREGHGLITSGILLRENTPEVRELCDRWHDELKRGSVRDQIAFACVQQKYQVGWVNIYKWDYSQSKEFKYIRHYKQRQ